MTELINLINSVIVIYKEFSLFDKLGFNVKSNPYYQITFF